MPAKLVNGWFRPWMPALLAALVMLAGFASAMGATNNKIDTNCHRIELMEMKLQQIGEDAAYTRGVIENEFGH